MNLIRAIVERSSTIWERMNGCFVPEETNQERVEFHVRKWIESIPSGSRDLLNQRLAHENLTIETVQRYLLPVHLPETEPLPAWTTTLKHWIASANYVAETSGTVPFEEILKPVAEEISNKLADTALQLLTESVWEEMKRNLTETLSYLCTPAIASELNLAHHLKKLEGETPQQQYQYFLKERLGSSQALLRFLSDYPVLAKLGSVRIDQWIEGTAEFLNRLRFDLREIEKTFYEGKPLGPVTGLKESISDPHNGGRTVKEILFQNGLKVLYKPKDLGIDIAFVNIIHWLNQQEISPGLRTVRLLSKNGYGWAEFVEWKPCSSISEVKEYYRRTGTLLCLLHVLGATDSHRENLIAAGASPVLVDMETLLRLPDRSAGGKEDTSAARLIYEDSVMSTGLLPEWRFGAHGRPGVDTSGISGEAHQESPFLKTKWEGFGSGLIHARLRHPVLKQLTNQPHLTGEKIQVQDYLSDIVTGFQEMYRFILKEQKQFCASPLFDDLCSQRVRYLNRPTKEYAIILDRSLDVESMRDGVTRSIRLDLLCRSLLNRKRENVWRLLEPERVALERLDIPYFSSRADSRSLCFDNSEFPDFFETSARQILINRFQRFSVADMQRQIDLIRGSFAARYDRGRVAEKELSDWQSQQPTTREQLLAAAAEIANRLIERAVHSSDGSLNWIGLEFIPAADQYQFQPMSSGLYSGLSGVVLFLSALHRFVPDSKYSDAARRAMRTMESQRRTTKPNELVRQYGAGGLTGIAAVAYALGWSSILQNDSSYMDEAMNWANLINRDAIQSERSIDFLSGLAGTAVALLRLYRWNQNEYLLANAIECGKRLISDSSKTGVSGFSHGASGISHALLQIYETTHKRDFLQTALITLGNENPTDKFSWCNGTPGMSLSRLTNASIFTKEVAVGINAAKEYGVNDRDHLCCGNCGRIDILLAAGRYLSRSELCDAAQRQMSAVLQRAGTTGAFQIMKSDDSENICHPGLFKGLSGIGYTCLRLADPENVLPSVLLLE